MISRVVQIETRNKELHTQASEHASKLDSAILWDFLVSLLHTASLRLLPRRAISFGNRPAGELHPRAVSRAAVVSLGSCFGRALLLVNSYIRRTAGEL